MDCDLHFSPLNYFTPAIILHPLFVQVLLVAVATTLVRSQATPLPSLQDSLVSWSRRLRDCHGDELCYEEADELLRPAVRQALYDEQLLEILPCLDGWGVYDVPTEGREWNFKANLPC